jgi:hypothetical protein
VGRGPGREQDEVVVEVGEEVVGFCRKIVGIAQRLNHGELNSVVL